MDTSLDGDDHEEEKLESLSANQPLLESDKSHIQESPFIDVQRMESESCQNLSPDRQTSILKTETGNVLVEEDLNVDEET